MAVDILDLSRVAQTNVALYRQMHGLGYDSSSLRRVRDAYELVCVPFAGHYRACGKPSLELAVSDGSLLSVHVPEAPVRLWGLLSGAHAKSAANPKNPTINPTGCARFAATPWDGPGQNILTRQWVS